MNRSSSSQGTLVQVGEAEAEATVISGSDFNRRYGHLLTDEERASLEAGDRVAFEIDTRVLVAEIVAAMTAEQRVAAYREYVAKGCFADGSRLYCPTSGRTLLGSERKGISAMVAASRGAS